MEPSAGVRSPMARRASDLCQRLPALLLGVALLLLVTGVPFNLTAIEPFDAWVWRAAGGMTIAIAVAGLVASVFVPQAYCRFGCPTGALLSFIRSRGPGDQWGTRDWTALVFLLIGVAAVSVTRALPRSSSVPEPTTLHGPTMGTTWTVKIRDEVADPPALEKAIAAQYELAEQMTSHWRTNTDLSAFNRSETTEPFPVPWPVVTLARWSAEISRATEGAFDITVGPLVRLWGFGPAPRRETPPTEQEITALRPAVGWEKLEILEGQLRKQQPGLQIDLSAIAPGWANDQVAQLLEHRGYTNFLVESGGELRARGAWTIAIEHPLRSCTLSNESIGTSGTYRQNWKKDGRQYSHLIDPRAGRPITHQTVSFSVRHADCAHADAWGCALNVLGVEAGLPLAERLGLAAQFVVEAQPGKLEIRASKAWAR